jgi:predicted aminopeptidase
MPLFFCLLPSCYLAQNAYHFTSLYNSRRKIDEVLQDGKTPETLKKNLLLVLEILQFAKQEGLNTEDKYTDYIDIGDRPISYIVEASEADQLKQVTWWFPIVGAVPYLGYYEKKERDEKADTLSKQGYDVYRGEAEAFSGLGWIRDPILSSYLRGGTSSLANLLFHELTHSTVWVPDHVVFNENLASYVGDVLTIQFLESRRQEEELLRYARGKGDRDLFTHWLQDLRLSLETLYTQRTKLSFKELMIQKKQIFALYLGEKHPHFQSVDYIGKIEWNNAHVLGSSLYLSKMRDFERARACLGNVAIGPFLRKIKETIRKKDDPFEVLNRFCESGDRHEQH